MRAVSHLGVNWSCYNGSNWVLLRNYPSSKVLYEEGINWYFGNSTLISPLNSSFKDSSSASYLFNWTQDVYYADQTNYRLEIWEKVPNYSPVSYWPLENGVATDFRGSSDGTLYGFDLNHGVRNGGVVIENSTGYFNGVDSFLNISFDDSLNVSDVVTFGAKFNPKGNPLNPWVMGNRFRIIYVESGNRYQCNFEGLSNVDIACSGIDPNQDTTIFCSYDGITTRIYKNGVLCDKQAASGNISIFNEPVYIGRRDATKIFNGSIDYTRIWHRNLTFSEILQENNSKYPVKSEGLVLSYDFDHFNSTHVLDTNNLVEGKDLNTEAMSFDGVDDEVRWQGNLNLTYPFTINTWVYLKNTDSDQNFFSITDIGTSTRYFALKYESGDSKFEIVKRNGAEGSYVSDSLDTVEQNKWYMLTGVFINETYMKIFLNGTFKDQRITGYITLDENFDGILLGNLRTSSPIYGNATLDESQLFRTNLSASQIKAIYENQSYKYNCSDGSPGALSDLPYGGTCPDTAKNMALNRTIDTFDLVSYWPLEYGNASDLRGSNDGTLSGFNFEHYHASDTADKGIGCLYDFNSRTDKTGNCTIGGGSGSIFIQSTGGVNNDGFINLSNVAERNYTGIRITPDTGFTYSLFVKNTDYNAGRDILSSSGHAAGRLYQYNEDVVFAIDNSTGDYNPICWIPINDIDYKGIWTHIAIMYNTTNDTISCYHEGNLIASVVLPSLSNTDYPTYFGSLYDTSARGGIDAFRAFDKAMPEKFIKAWAYVNESYTQAYNCDDSIRNGDETGVDIGGNCTVQQGHDGNSTTSLRFDGIDDSINTNIGNHTELTVLMWIYTNSNTGTFMRLFEYGNSGLEAFFDNSVSKIRARTINTTGNNVVTAYEPVEMYDWEMLTVSINGSNISIYINDEYRSSAMYSGIPRFDDGSFTFGSEIGGTRSFNGSIDEVMIFNRALTTSEIKAIYQNQSYKYNCSDGSPGALNGSNCGGTCSDSCTHSQVSINDFIINADNEWRVCVLNDTKVEYCTVQNELYYNFIPVIGNIRFYLRDLLNGNQHYNISFNVTDGTEPNTCNITTQSGTFNLTWDNQARTCTGNFSIPQSNANVFSLNVNDGINGSSSTGYEGVEIEFNRYQADPTKTSTLITQYFLKDYNLTNNINIQFNNTQWSLNQTDPVKTLNLSLGLTHNNITTYSAYFITEDEDYTFSGSVFLARAAYAVTKYMLYNNTLAKQLPAISLSIPLKRFNDSLLAEKQDGLFWPDLSSTQNQTHAQFTIDPVNASDSKYYRYGYNAIFSDWDGDVSSDYRLSGQTKEWTLDRTYKLYFNLSDRTLVDYVLASNLGEWVSKTGTWGSTLIRQGTGLAFPHTTTDNIQSIELEIDAVPLDNYTYQLLYYSPISGGTSSGGGGGGGGAAPTIIESPTTTPLQVKWGKVVYGRKISNIIVSALPSVSTKEMLIQANGSVAGVAQFSENLAPHCQVEICDVGTDVCELEKVVMQDGESKLLRYQCDLPVEFAETLVQNKIIEGKLTIKTPTTASEHPIVIEKAVFYEIIHKLANGQNESAFAFGIYAALVAIVMTGLYITIRSMNGG